MTEINITEFFNNEDPARYSASVAELGEDAGRITWSNARSCTHKLLQDEEDRVAMRVWMQNSGGWEDEEILAMTDWELNALFIQLVSAEIREDGDNIFDGDDGETYFYLGE